MRENVAVSDRLLSLDEARGRVVDIVHPLPVEDVSVEDALGRVLAEDVEAVADVPGFRNSAMDGYALMAGPAGRRLRIVGESRAGSPASLAPGADEALRISTGALVPPGVDAVLRREDAEEADGEVLARASTRPGQSIREAGEDLCRGALVLACETTLGPPELGLAVAAGRAHVRCARRPAIAILATGDELAAPGVELGAGQIHDSNSIALAAYAARVGAEVCLRERVDDTPGATREALERALDAADVVVVSGGVSVGEHDHVKGALGELGVREEFWRVALKPGKPVWFGTREERLVFGLPGNPVSSLVCFALFVAPALRALQGATSAPARVTAVLAADVARAPDRTSAVRVLLERGASGLEARPTGPQGSHVLSSMLGADGLAFVAPGEGSLSAGANVEVELL